ncbi:MAG TPA: HAD family phosphatase [Candidatus Saccharimonadales bacterium]|nr:HAD family phosphatase [Candidatus Saccharimonadales bacterium]
MTEFRPVRAIIFDIDGTLTPEVSWTSLTAGLGASADEHLRIFNNFLDGSIDYPESKRQLLGLWQSTGKANQTFISELFAAWPLKPEAPAVIAELQKDYQLCLITGSMDLYAATIARKVGVQEWHANTELIWNGQGNLVDYAYQKDQAGQKLTDFEAFCAAHGISPDECVAVGDSKNDLALFAACGRGVLLAEAEPSPELAPHAWKTIHSLTELPSLLLKG